MKAKEKSEMLMDFLRFADSKDMHLGGIVVYGFGMEHSDFRPLHKDDYQNVIDDFLASLPSEGREG